MTDLSGAGVRVLLIATANHNEPPLTPVPSITTTFHDLKAALVDRCGVRPEALHGVLDPPDARAMAMAVTEAAHQADTVLLVYFIGHGLLGPDDELYLAARSTGRLAAGMAEHQALSFSSLRQAVSACRASSVVVVLDCCFSGRPSLGASMLQSAFGTDPAYGLFLIGSAEQLALAPSSARHTAFTGALLDVLANGDSRGPRVLTLDALYDGVFRVLQDQRRPLPRRQAGDRSGHLRITSNPAFPAPDGRPPAPELPPGPCPYLGLDAFQVADSDLFFGRDAMTASLLDAVARADKGPLALVGSSGSGKTSLLNAGFLAGLRKNGLDGMPGSVGWPALRLTPGTRPLRTLAACLDAGEPDAAQRLLADPGHAVALVDALLSERPGQRLILVVDQLEELFTLCTRASERAAFVRAVAAIGTSPARGLVVLALRADFYGQAAEHPELHAVLRDNQLLVEPMAAADLRAAIEKPAAAAGLELDGLADVILHELGVAADEPPASGALPLLSHVLWATWREATTKRLTVADYRAAGGISKAIESTADKVYDALDPVGQDAVRLMVSRLVTVGDTADTARPVELAALTRGLPDPAAARQAINQLADARLLTLDRDTARISHEALLRAWPRLKEWIDADRDWLRARQRLLDDATGWDAAARDPSHLYRGNHLAAVRELADASSSRAGDLEPIAAEFMDASREHQERDKRLAERRRNRVVAVLSVLLLVAVAGLVGSLLFQRQAQQAEGSATARYLAAEAGDLRDRQPGLAKQLSLLAYSIDPAAGRSAVLDSQRTPGVINGDEAAHDLASSSDGRVLAISTGEAIEIRAPGGQGRVAARQIGSIAVSANGRLLAAATQDTLDPGAKTTVRLWDITEYTRPRQTAELGVDAAVGAIGISTDGSALFAGTSTGTLLGWDIGHPAEPKSLPPLKNHATAIDSMAVSPQRGLMASISGDGVVQLWDIGTATRPVPIGTLDGASAQAGQYDQPTPLHRVAFDRTGTVLANVGTALSEADVPDVWTLENPRAAQRMPFARDDLSPTDEQPRGHCVGNIKAVAFDPRSDILATACESSGWHLWLYQTRPGSRWVRPSLAAVQRVSPASANTILFAAGQPGLLMLATNRGVQVWDATTLFVAGSSGRILVGSSPIRSGVANSLALRWAGDRPLLAVIQERENQLWDVTDPRHPGVVFTAPAPKWWAGAATTLSPDGSVLAVAEALSDTRWVLRLRDTANPHGEPLATVDTLANGVAALAFSPTTRLLAVSDHNSESGNSHSPPTIRVYDLTDRRHPRQVAQFDATSGHLAFAPSSAVLTATVTGSQGDLRMRSWDLNEPGRPVELWSRPLTPGQQFASIAYRPDGAYLAVFEGTGILRLWPVNQHRLVGDPLTVRVAGAAGSDVVFSRDGTRLALMATEYSVTRSARAEIWDVTTPESPVRQSSLPIDSTALDPTSLAFSPDGATLAVARRDGIDLLDTRPDQIAKSLCAAVGDPITRQEWDRYLPGRPYQPPCP